MSTILFQLYEFCEAWTLIALQHPAYTHWLYFAHSSTIYIILYFSFEIINVAAHIKLPLLFFLGQHLQWRCIHFHPYTAHGCIYILNVYVTISMSLCKKDVTPLLTHWSYVFLALTHQCGLPVPPRVCTHGMAVNITLMCGLPYQMQGAFNGDSDSESKIQEQVLQVWDRMYETWFARVSILGQPLVVLNVYLENFKIYSHFPSCLNIKMVQIIDIILHERQEHVYSKYIMAADDLVTGEARTSAAMVLTLNSQYISVSAPEGLTKYSLWYFIAQISTPWHAVIKNSFLWKLCILSYTWTLALIGHKHVGGGSILCAICNVCQ